MNSDFASRRPARGASLSGFIARACLSTLSCWLPTATGAVAKEWPPRAQEPLPAPPPALTVAEKAADLEALLTFVRDVHPDPYWYHDRAIWQRAEQGLRERLAALDDAAFTWELAQLVALLHDGHSVLVRRRFALEERTLVPIEVRWLADGPFVVATTDTARVLLGGRLVSIGGIAMAELAARLGRGIGADNEPDLHQRLPRALNRPWLLHQVGVAGGGDGIRVVVDHGDGGTPTALVVAPVPGEQPFAQRVRTAEGVDLVRERHPERKFFAEELPELDALYVRLRAVEDDGDQSLAPFLAGLPRLAASRLVHRLVIDVRGNPGGSNDHVRAFVRDLQTSEYDAAGRLFVLTDGATFSAAQNLCTWLERDTHALFVGAPTGGRPNHFGDAQVRMLPATGALVAISSRRWQDSAPDDARAFLAPDLPVPMTFADLLAGRDPVLASVGTAREALPEVGDRPRWRRASQRSVPTLRNGR